MERQNLQMILYLIFIGSITPLTDLHAQNLNGLWKDTYWGPMTSYFYFDTETSSFKYYYHDDTHGSFGKGHFSLKRNKINLTFDSIICDRPEIELLDNDLINDTTYISFFQYWGFPKRIDLFAGNQTIYSNRTSSSESLIEDHLLIKIPKILDSLEFIIYDSNGSIDKEVTRFSVRLFDKPYCNLFYYPSNGWYDFKKPTNRVMVYKIKWINNDFFMIPRKYKFQKIN